MTTVQTSRKYLPDAAATMRVGADLAPGLHGGMTITLSGELGSGKTTLVRGILHGLGWTGPVKSPTYTLLEDYLISSLYLYHFDFYRFKEPAEWEDSGFAEYFRPDALCLIEWPERLDGLLPLDRLDIALETQGQGRRAKLNGRGKWRARVGSI